MREKNKNIKSSPEDFIRYREDKMKDEERNAFERELQKDPFLRDAFEGWDSIEQNEANNDLSYLQKQLKHRLVKPQRVIFYRIAASVAVLVVISSLFIVIERNRTPKQIASVTEQVKPSEKIESEPSTIQADKSEISKPDDRIPEKKKDRSVEQQKKPAYVQPAAPVEKKENVRYETPDSITDININKAEEYAAPEQIAAAEPVMAQGKTASASRYIPPQPAAGKSNFDRYIRKNLRRPDSTSLNQGEVVILSFIVQINGSLDSIRIIKSPGKLFSDEAVRLITSGPAWKPAEKNGQPVEDEVRLRIIFK